METTQKIGNNNQSVTNQNSPITCKSGCSKASYLCISKGHPSDISKAPHNYHRLKHTYENDNYQINYSKLSELCNKNMWYQYKGHSVEEPIDLTCSERRNDKGRSSNTAIELPMVPNNSNFEFENQQKLNLTEFQKLEHSTNNIKRRGRKRKPELKTEHISEEVNLYTFQFQNPDPNILKPFDNRNYLQIADNKQAEVIKAAKSLFSKRTRTLYHWMYPTAPKAQLKAAVASSWETLGTQEKEFYISQVLGRFGFPQTNLMVNPQLGGIPGISQFPLLDLTAANHIGNEETSTAVSTLLMSENRNSSDGLWMQSGQGSSSNPSNCTFYSQKVHKKRGRLGRPPGSKNRRLVKEDVTLLKQIREEPPPDEFQDDPELNREFQQFKWTLHLSDNEKS